MANRIKIRHGNTLPTTADLLPYELGWDGSNLYINDNGVIKKAVGQADSVPLSGVTNADNLKAIEALDGTNGLLRKTAVNTWTLDTTAYTTNTGTVTNICIQATSPIVSSVNTEQTVSLNTTISLVDAYGDTKNPYGAKIANQILAGPSSGNASAPIFRALVEDDIPNLSVNKITSGTLSINLGGTGATTAAAARTNLELKSGAITTINSGSSDPTGGTNGDIYFQYEE